MRVVLCGGLILPLERGRYPTLSDTATRMHHIAKPELPAPQDRSQGAEQWFRRRLG